MAKYTFKIIIQVDVETELSEDDARDEIASECSYDFPSTDNVTVIKQEWTDTL